MRVISKVQGEMDGMGGKGKGGGGEDRGTLRYMLHTPVTHVPLSIIPAQRPDINQDILLDAGEAIEAIEAAIERECLCPSEERNGDLAIGTV